MSAGSNIGVSSAARARSVDSDTLVAVGRAGWVAKGAIYLLIGILAWPIAFSSSSSGEGSEEASRRGALAAVADNSFGGVLLVILGVGLALYALWRLASAALPGRSDSEAKVWAHRAAYVFSGLSYAVLAFTALSVVFGGGSTGGGGGSGGGGGGSRFEQVTRDVLDWTLGRWLVGLAGAALIGLGGYFAVKGFQRKFLEQIDLTDAGSNERSAIVWGGTIGWIGRGAVVALLGVFLIDAAVTYDADQAEGLDGALRQAAEQPFGTFAVAFIAVALMIYGGFAALSARHRLILGP